MPFLLFNDHLIACKNRRDRGLHIHSNAKAAEAMKLSYCLGASSDNRTGRKRWRKTGMGHDRGVSGLIWFHPGGEKVDGHPQLSSGVRCSREMSQPHNDPPADAALVNLLNLYRREDKRFTETVLPPYSISIRKIAHAAELIIFEGLLNLLQSIHHEWAATDNRFVDRLATH